MSPSSVVPLRWYRSTTMVSCPSVTMNAPRASWAASGTAAARANSVSPRPPNRMRSGLLFHAYGLQFVVLFYHVHDVHAFGYLSENGVDAVQMPLRGVADEKLAAAGVL